MGQQRLRELGLNLFTDEGDSWREIASYLPGVASVEVAVLA